MEIILKNVNYIYSPGTPYETPALKDVNLRLSSDDGFTSIIGSTGSGKSTLAQLLNGTLTPSEGIITWEDDDFYFGFSGNEPKSRSHKKGFREICRRVGLVFQFPEHQLFASSVLEDVSYGPKNLGIEKSKAEEKAALALRAVGISKDLFLRSPFELSGGQMRRVAIAGVLAMEPKILVLDEPTAGLDPAGSEEILGLLKRLSLPERLADKVSYGQLARNLRSGENQSRQTGIIMISHDMYEVREYSNRVILLGPSDDDAIPGFSRGSDDDKPNGPSEGLVKAVPSTVISDVSPSEFFKLK